MAARPRGPPRSWGTAPTAPEGQPGQRGHVCATGRRPSTATTNHSESVLRCAPGNTSACCAAPTTIPGAHSPRRGQQCGERVGSRAELFELRALGLLRRAPRIVARGQSDAHRPRHRRQQRRPSPGVSSSPLTACHRSPGSRVARPRRLCEAESGLHTGSVLASGERVADQPERRWPQPDEDRPPLSVTTHVLMHRLGANPHRCRASHGAHRDELHLPRP